eukprot:gene17989-8539_t
MFTKTDPPLYQRPHLSRREIADLDPIRPRLTVCKAHIHPAAVSGAGAGSGAQQQRGRGRTRSSSGLMDVHVLYNVRDKLYWHAGQTEKGYKPSDVVVSDAASGSASALSRHGSGVGPAHSPTCHDINLVSRSPDTLEVAVGYCSGEVVVRELRSGKSSWLLRPKNSAAAILAVRWIPGTELLMVADSCGGIAVYDKDRKMPKKDRASSSSSSSSSSYVGGGRGGGSASSVGSVDDAGGGGGDDGDGGNGSGGSSSDRKRARSNAKGAGGGLGGVGGLVVHWSKKGSSANPVSNWSFRGINHAMYDISFSPDTEHVAFVGVEGVLRVCHYAGERQVIAGASFFGELYCAAWSPDGRLVLAAGQDDWISLWSFEHRTIVARAQGHSSWVMGIAFDPFETDDANYRFGSVGLDGKLLLWDMERRPASIARGASFAAAAGRSPPPKSGGGGGGGGGGRRSSSGSASTTIRAAAAAAVVARDREAAGLGPEVIAKGVGEVVVIEPVATVHASDEPCTAVHFLQNMVITMSSDGTVDTMDRLRPPAAGVAAGSSAVYQSTCKKCNRINQQEIVGAAAAPVNPDQDRIVYQYLRKHNYDSTLSAFKKESGTQSLDQFASNAA